MGANQCNKISDLLQSTKYTFNSFSTIKTDDNIENMNNYFESLKKRDINGNKIISRSSLRIALNTIINPKSTE